MDINLLNRTIVTLRWLTADAIERFNDCRRNIEDGSQGGYSPELTEALAVLNELENPPSLIAPPQRQTYTLQECLDVGYVCGVTPASAEEFFNHYNSQGWLKGNGLPIFDLKSTMVTWRNRQVKIGGGEPLPPTKDCLGFTPRQQDIKEHGR